MLHNFDAFLVISGNFHCDKLIIRRSGPSIRKPKPTNRPFVTVMIQDV